MFYHSHLIFEMRKLPETMLKNCKIGSSLLRTSSLVQPEEELICPEVVGENHAVAS